jgi:hypothetical protein
MTRDEFDILLQAWRSAVSPPPGVMGNLGVANEAWEELSGALVNAYAAGELIPNSELVERLEKARQEGYEDGYRSGASDERGDS